MSVLGSNGKLKIFLTYSTVVGIVERGNRTVPVEKTTTIHKQAAGKPSRTSTAL